jgi:hypothetical protein
MTNDVGFRAQINMFRLASKISSVDCYVAQCGVDGTEEDE